MKLRLFCMLDAIKPSQHTKEECPHACLRVGIKIKSAF
uniref:Uncharacterized protein n=1 Tax=Rhizophora mucronata TaxID=61149 RepID=A0A2P2QB61_RHIMU